MKILNYLLFAFFLFYGVGVFGQDCDTEATQGQVDFMNNTRQIRDAFILPSSSFTHYIPVQFHIIRDDNGDGVNIANISDLEDELDVVNNLYAPINMVFFQCGSVNYIDDSNLWGDWEDDIATANNIDGKINIYCVPGEDISSASFPYQQDYEDRIMYAEDQWYNTSTLAHEIGHYFNLYHTHENYQGLEHPDRSGANKNCGPNYGDELCDTEADPVLYDRVNNNCEYDSDLDPTPNSHSGYKINELGLDDYAPNPHNIMCWIDPDLSTCRDFLSDGQLDRVLRSYMCDRSYLFCDDLALPDLVVTNETATPETVIAGEDFNVSCKVRNIGGASANSVSLLRYYLSKDPVFQNSQDIYLGYDWASQLGVGWTSPESANLTIPPNLSTGVWYVLFMADLSNKVIEGNEINNVTALQINVISGENEPDLIVIDQSVNKTTVAQGEEIYISAHVKNVGDAYATKNTRLKYYLSDAETLSGGTYYHYFGADYVNGLDPGEDGFEYIERVIPSDAPEGNNFIIFRADALNDAAESNEFNNFATQPIFVTASSSGKTSQKEATQMLSTKLKANAAPNPFEETTTIEYTLDKPSTVFIDVYDVTGKKVAQLLEGEEQREGNQTIEFEATDLPDGLYFCQINTGDEQQTLRILLQR